MSVKRLATLIAAVGLLGALIPVTALAAAGGGGNTSNNLCPSSNSLANFVAYSNVAASSTGTSTARTYFFKSFTSENVPGLTGYCVYPTDQVTAGATAVYPNWTATQLKGTKGFVFQRSGGDKNDVPLNGTTYTIGTATFGAWTAETILLHINDATACTTLYGAGSSASCWVYPSASVGPICNAGTGNTAAAYNSMPTDVEHCGAPSYAFEGNFANEFGDEVTLDTTGGNKLASMTVDFQSYGCGDSGRWYTGDCVTNAGNSSFTIPGGVTAKIYDPNGSGGLTTPIATVTINPSIPFRPTGDSANCGGTDPNGYADNSRWYDTVSMTCKYSIAYPLTFTFAPGTTFTSGQEVVWTVQFNTTHGGYSPIGESTTCFQTNPPGCGYDSLNVGTMSYPSAPYAGTDVAEGTVFISTGNSVWAPPFVALASVTNAAVWTGYRPLGEIVLAP